MKTKDLKKLAAALRSAAAKLDAEKNTKCANLLVGAIGLEVLSKKIYESRP